MIDKPLYDNPLGGGASYFNPIGHTPNPSIGMQNPGEGNLANLEDGLMFLIDKDRPRTEDEIKSLYQKAQEDAARQRREGFLGQVVLPGEMSYEDYTRFRLQLFVNAQEALREVVAGIDPEESKEQIHLLEKKAEKRRKKLRRRKNMNLSKIKRITKRYLMKN